MENEQVLPVRLTKADITVRIELAGSESAPEFLVVYPNPKDGKLQRERFSNLDEARKRGEAVLSEIFDATYPIDLSKQGIGAKIYFTPTSNGYDAYTLVYYQEGKRKREAFGSVDAARERGKQVRDALAKGEITAANMTLEDANAYVRSKQHLEGTGVGLETACKEYAELLRLLNGVSPLHVGRDYARRHNGAVTNRTVQQVVDEFLAAKRDGRATRLRGNGRKVSARYLYDLERKLTAFAGRFRMPIGMVSSEEINRFVHEIKGSTGRPTKKNGASARKPVSGRTKNNYIQAINVLFEFAKKQKYLPRDHDVLDEVETAAESDFAIEIFAPEELKKLLGKADPLLVPVLALGAFAGLRTAEIDRLDWSEVHLAQRFIEVKAQKAKTRARRLVPITDNLAKWLKDCAQKEGRVWPHSAPYLFELQREAGKAAGVPWKHNALRHSFISYRLAVVKNVDQVAMEAGNSAQMIFQHYRELVTPEAAEAWFAIAPPRGGKVVRLPLGKAEGRRMKDEGKMAGAASGLAPAVRWA